MYRTKFVILKDKRKEGFLKEGIVLIDKKNFADAVIALQKSLSLQHNISAYMAKRMYAEGYLK